MTPVDLLDAEKTLEPVFLYVFRITFTASLLTTGLVILMITRMEMMMMTLMMTLITAKMVMKITGDV